MSVPRLPPLNCVWVLSKDTCKSWLVDFATNHSLISVRRRLHRFQTVHEIKSETLSGDQIYNSNQEWNILAPSLHWLNAEMTASPPPSTKRNKQCIKEQGNGTIRLRKRNKWGDFIPKIIEGLNFTYAYNQYIHVNVLFVSSSDNKLDHLLWTRRQIRQSNNWSRRRIKKLTPNWFHNNGKCSTQKERLRHLIKMRENLTFIWLTIWRFSGSPRAR